MPELRNLLRAEKIVLDVDNAPDKSFDLTDEDTKVTLPTGVKIGDPVKVTERTVNGKNVVQIAQHSGGGVKHGDTAGVKHGDEANDADVTYGRVKEFTAGRKIVLDVDNAPDKSFDLTDEDTKVTLPTGVKIGDPVKVTERTVNGKNIVQIAQHSGGGVKHGDKTRSEERRQ